jgi:hypothetical protein
MYILLLLLLFTPSVQATEPIEHLCNEVTREVLIAIEEGYIDKQAGVELIDGCWTRENRP